jgi:exonuclease III
LYIAEIIRNFDLVAIQEAKDDLGGIEKLQEKLGRKYRFLFSDPAGNSERLVFCYDSAKIQFTGLAAEIVLAPGQGKETVRPELEFERTPYMASFRTNGCNFIVVTVHIYYGSGSKVKYRLDEIKNVAAFLEKRSADTDSLDSDYIACGDFNIEKVKENIQSENPLERLFSALQSKGLIIPEKIQDSPSNLAKTKHFDQIGFHQYKDSTISFRGGGVIDFVGAVYVGDTKLEYKMTDHLPLWAVFDTKPDKKPKYINP